MTEKTEYSPLGDGEELNQKLSELSQEEMEKIAGGNAGIFYVTAASQGIVDQIAGFTISAADSTDEKYKAGTPQPE